MIVTGPRSNSLLYRSSTVLLYLSVYWLKRNRFTMELFPTAAPPKTTSRILSWSHILRLRRHVISCNIGRTWHACHTQGPGLQHYSISLNIGQTTQACESHIRILSRSHIFLLQSHNSVLLVATNGRHSRLLTHKVSFGLS